MHRTLPAEDLNAMFLFYFFILFDRIGSGFTAEHWHWQPVEDFGHQTRSAFNNSH